MPPSTVNADIYTSNGGKPQQHLLQKKKFDTVSYEISINDTDKKPAEVVADLEEKMRTMSQDGRLANNCSVDLPLSNNSKTLQTDRPNDMQTQSQPVLA